MQVSDGIKVGTAGAPGVDSRAPLAIPVGSAIGLTGNFPLISPSQPGAPNVSDGLLNILPLGALNNNIATSQTASGAALTLTAGTGVTSSSITIGGVTSTYLALDCARCVTVVGGSTNVTGASMTVVGLDTYFQPQTQTFTGPTSSATVNTLKAFQYIKSVTANGNTTGPVTVGTADIFGLPYRVDDYGYIGNICFNQAPITSSAGFVKSDTTSPQTAANGDPRGTYALQSTSSNGSRRLVVQTILPDTSKIDSVYGFTPA